MALYASNGYYREIIWEDSKESHDLSPLVNHIVTPN